MATANKLFLLIPLLLFFSFAKGQKLTGDILSKYKWVSSYGLNETRDSLVVLYSNKDLLEAQRKDACPYYTWVFLKNWLSTITLNRACEGGEPPKGEVSKFLKSSEFKIINLFGFDCLIIRVNEAVNFYQIREFKKIGNGYMLSLLLKQPYKLQFN